MMTDLRFEDGPVRPARRRGSIFRRDRQNGKIFGVCAGMAEALDLDVTLVRVAWIAGTLLGFGSLLLIYLAIALLAD
ncbi:PspC domain-containing protein [Novosphingobium sp. SG720]|uniref:PspC domain-containing protein n=1 Tax=Novosphingobium sp. SG720 TaxID=2586998 RepID=UPI0017A911FE|nr:PspC domain-containing protein [Novosphingobium sp. SG720]NKJ44727.1 phage shock protein C [Novosphingobium sp. SG720]